MAPSGTKKEVSKATPAPSIIASVCRTDGPRSGEQANIRPPTSSTTAINAAAVVDRRPNKAARGTRGLGTAPG
ncbi:hypothetical protein TPAU25S_02886 [Tsukamurella paurometabola]